MASQSDVLTAVQRGDVETMRKLLNQDPSLAFSRDSSGVSALMHSYYLRRPEIADLLLRVKRELDIFEASAAAGMTARVSEILDRDRLASKSWSADGFTALHLAAFFATQRSQAR